MSQRQHDSIDTEHLCRLARLALTPAEAGAVQADLQRIIAMIDAMAAVSVTGVEPLANPLEAAARLRADEATEQVDAQAFARLAPETADGLYLVPRVVD